MIFNEEPSWIYEKSIFYHQRNQSCEQFCNHVRKSYNDRSCDNDTTTNTNEHEIYSDVSDFEDFLDIVCNIQLKNTKKLWKKRPKYFLYEQSSKSCPKLYLVNISRPCHLFR